MLKECERDRELGPPAKRCAVQAVSFECCAFRHGRITTQGWWRRLEPVWDLCWSGNRVLILPHLDSEPSRASGPLRKRNVVNAMGFDYSAIRFGRSPLTVMGTRWKRVGGASHSVRLRDFPPCRIGPVVRTLGFHPREHRFDPGMRYARLVGEEESRDVLSVESAVRFRYKSLFRRGLMASQHPVKVFIIEVRPLSSERMARNQGHGWSAKPASRVQVPLAPLCDCSSDGRARPCHGRGHGFDPRQSLQVGVAQRKCTSLPN